MGARTAHTGEKPNTVEAGASSYFNLASFIAAVLVGACIGFLPLNWNPAKMFMGDSGALMLGLLMATSAIAITGQLDPAIIGDNDVFGRSQLLGAFIPILLPIVVVILPLLDFGLAVIRRMGAGKSPFSPDSKHLHQRMLDMGHSDRDAVLIFYAWTAVVSLAFLLMYIGTAQEWPGDYLLGVVFGAVGRFWRPVIDWRQVGPDEFAEFDEPGWGKIAANFSVNRYGEQHTLLSYQCRTVTTDPDSRRRFRRYWWLIRPFVAHIMRATVATIKADAEFGGSRAATRSADNTVIPADRITP